MYVQENTMKCNFLLDDRTPGCIAGELPYNQTGFQTEEYCRKAEHRKCPFYITRMTKEEAKADTAVPEVQGIQEGCMAKSILVVDDAAVVRHVVSLTLKKSGYAVVEAVNGKDALEKLGVSEIEMVITDLNMPEMDGIELIRNMRNTIKYKFMPILMLTTVSQEEKRQEGRQAGASGWLFKPFHSTQLLEAVRKYVV